MSKKSDTMNRKQFIDELLRYKRGSVTRRHFMSVTGLATASAVMAGAMPGLRPRRSWAAGDIGDRVVLATWPNYHEVANFDALQRRLAHMCR